MRVYDIIERKKLGEKLTNEEIKYIVDGYVKNEIPDYQVSALLMAIYFQGMAPEETFDLTKAMIESGDTVDLSKIDGIKVDKHSTGGVGDKTSLVLLPLMASFGLKVSKMSGRGLGHTGGTIDKLESIKGFNVNLTREKMFDIVNKVGFAIAGQTGNLVPADKKLYSLRDVTATVDNISLIASSIMSKKIAGGADYILLDVKVGSGAFMEDLEDAIKLSKEMVDIGNRFNKKTYAVLTNMDQPLGNKIGNALEVKEAIETLKNEGPKDFANLCKYLNAVMLKMVGKVESVEEGLEKTSEMLESSTPFDKFKEFVKMQQGDVAVIENIEKLPKAGNIIEVKSNKDGYVKSIDAKEIGISAMMTGAGRENKESELDYSAGIVLSKKVGDKVQKGEAIAYIHSNINNNDEIAEKIKSAVSISEEIVDKPRIIYGYVDSEGYHENE
ncbi:MAG: pyrimidine-nucleoside phosphorylase [Bacillota bacterium]|nr:pyrimidine-nucleoside phosphorylase [Bacillota bacterium]